MSNTNVAVLFIIGAILVGAGIFLRFIKFESASLFLILGMTFDAAAALMLIVKIIIDKKKR